MSYDGNWLYLVDDFAPIANIFDTFFEDGYWVRSKKLKKPITSKSNETHAFISPDGKTLYFTSDRPGGYGGLDIYKSTQDQKERWGDPVNLGPKINTEFNEENPFLTPDGKYLFFSSEGHNSIGGYDIFYTDIQANGEIERLGYPINSADDNLFFFPLSIESGYASYFDPKGFGPLDIFEVKIFPSIFLKGKLLATNEIANEESNLTISISNLDESKVLASINSTLSEGSFTQKIVPGNYQVKVTGDGFEDFITDFSLADDYNSPTYDLDLLLNPISQQPLIAEVVQPEIIKLIEPEPEQQIEQVKEVVPEVKTEPVVTEEPVKPLVVEVVKKEEKKVVSEPKITFSDEIGTYTVQIMALIVPVTPESFTNISGVSATRGADGFYRYTVGAAETKEEAQEIRNRLVQLGYKGAFVRQLPKPVKYHYTIQIMALRNPVDLKRFSNLENVFVENSPDNIYRYNVGIYNTLDNANYNLQRVIELGYKDAFVKKK
ncbi:MAG: hypothetical protein CVT95_06100 [Bacteroidetes bacterium HGW-Bacteroidetes-12]|nr:MAG: hypothetical protein CVT95_06100 [Bacteroidetes bacterium HGW-Bacteroidetes-12]